MDNVEKEDDIDVIISKSKQELAERFNKHVLENNPKRELTIGPESRRKVSKNSLLEPNDVNQFY